MDPITIASLISMVAGSYMQHQAQQDAIGRQQRVIQQGLQQQRELQQQAEKKAMDTAQTFKTEDRNVEQQKIADTTTQNLAQPVEQAQNLRAEQQSVQGNTSDAYKNAKAKSDVQTLQNAQQLARMLGKVSSAGRLRANEAVNILNAGQGIDQLNSFSRGDQAANQIALQGAGQVDPNAMMVGGILQGVGSAGMAGGFGGSSPVSEANLTAANASNDPIAYLNDAKGWTGSNNNYADAFRGMRIFK